MPELVDVHVLDESHAREGPAQDPRVRLARDERRILHAARAEAVLGRIHDRQRLVGIRPEPEAVERQGHVYGLDVAVARALVPGLEEEPDAHGPEGDRRRRHRELSGGERRPAGRNVRTRVESELVDLVERVGRPGEVVHVVGDVLVGPPVAALAFRDALACRADDEVRRDRQRHVVAAVVGIELRVGVEGVAVPSPGGPPPHPRGLVDADLREPLPDEVEIADIARAREDPGQLRAKVDRERDLSVGRNGRWQLYGDNGLVRGVVAVGLDEAHRRLEIHAVGRLQG